MHGEIHFDEALNMWMAISKMVETRMKFLDLEESKQNLE